MNVNEVLGSEVVGDGYFAYDNKLGCFVIDERSNCDGIIQFIPVPGNSCTGCYGELGRFYTNVVAVPWPYQEFLITQLHRIVIPIDGFMKNVKLLHNLDFS